MKTDKRCFITCMTMLLLIILLSIGTGYALELKELDIPSKLRNLDLGIDVDYGYIAGGFDKDGNWVIRYAVERPLYNTTTFIEFFKKAEIAVQIWNSSIRKYAEEYNCSHLKKLILRFTGYTDEGEYDVKIRLGGAPADYQHLAGAYYPDSKVIAVVGSYSSYYLFIIVHEMGHSLGLDHMNRIIRDVVDLRGYVYHIGSSSLADGGSSLVELYALCQLYEPISRGGKPYLKGRVSLPDNLKNEFIIMYSIIHTYVRRYRDIYVEPPLPVLPTFRTIHYYVLDNFFNLQKIIEYPIGLYGQDIIVYPLHSYCEYVSEYRAYICGHDDTIVVDKDYHNGTLDAVLDFNISKVVYSKMYVLNESGWATIYVLGDKPKLEDVKLPEGLSWNDVKYVVSLREEKCLPGECYESIEWMKDGRILVKNVKKDIIVDVKVGKAYAYNIDIPLLNYSLTIDSPERLRRLTISSDGKNITYTPRNSKIYIRLNSTIHDFKNGSRLIVDGWSVGSWNGTHLEVLVDKPVDVRPRLIKQHLVTVKPSIGDYANIGWVNDGERISVYPLRDVIDFGNGSRLVFKGFREEYGNTTIYKKTFESIIDKPITLEAEWSREYRVVVQSRYFTSMDKWVKEGETYFALVSKEVDFKNGTLIRLKDLKITIGGEKVEPEDLDASYRILFQVNNPVEVKAEWETYYLVEASSIAPIEACTGLFKEGSVWNATAEESIQYGNGTIRKFIGWIVDGELLPERTINIKVLKPLKIEAYWKTLDYVSFTMDAGAGYIVPASRVVLEKNGEKVVIEGSGFIERGLWALKEAWFKDAEVGFYGSEVMVRGPGTVMLPSKLRAVKIKVVDILGIPSPNVKIDTLYSSSSTGLDGLATLPAIPLRDIELQATHLLGTTVEKISPDVSEALVRIPLSIYSLIAIITLSVATGYIVLRRLVKRGKSF